MEPAVSEAPQLVQFLLSVVHGLRDPPGALRFDDFLMPDAVSNINEFSRFVEQIGVWPEEILRGNRESSIVLPSGVKASFIDNRLSALVLSKRERDESRSPSLTDEREPSVQQVKLQISINSTV